MDYPGNPANVNYPINAENPVNAGYSMATGNPVQNNPGTVAPGNPTNVNYEFGTPETLTYPTGHPMQSANYPNNPGTVTPGNPTNVNFVDNVNYPINVGNPTTVSPTGYAHPVANSLVGGPMVETISQGNPLNVGNPLNKGNLLNPLNPANPVQNPDLPPGYVGYSQHPHIQVQVNDKYDAQWKAWKDNHIAALRASNHSDLEIDQDFEKFFKTLDGKTAFAGNAPFAGNTPFVTKQEEYQKAKVAWLATKTPAERKELFEKEPHLKDLFNATHGNFHDARDVYGNFHNAPVLRGTLTKAAVNGKVTFSDLSIDNVAPGMTCQLVATVGEHKITSEKFSVVAGDDRKFDADKKAKWSEDKFGKEERKFDANDPYNKDKFAAEKAREKAEGPFGKEREDDRKFDAGTEDQWSNDPFGKEREDDRKFAADKKAKEERAKLDKAEGSVGYYNE